MSENEERSSLSERRQRRRTRRQEMLRHSGEGSSRNGESSRATTSAAAVADTAITRGKTTATPSRRQTDQSSFLSSFVLFRPIARFWGYLQNVGVEIRKVAWPSRADARRLTGIVLIVTIAAALILGLVSFGLSELFRYGIETPLILLGTFAIIVAGTIYRLRRAARSASY